MSILSNAMRAALVAVAILTLASPANAGSLPVPTGHVILKVTGAVTNTNTDDKARFDRAALEAMATDELLTSTPWTKGVQRFRGFQLDTLLRAVGATGNQLRAIALNDYSSVMPIDDTVASGAFLAVRVNGEPMSVRDRGPLWIVFPYDSNPRLTTDAYLNRSVWQLKELVVE
jgi:hypothetical protein